MIEHAFLLPPHIIDLPKYRELFKNYTEVRLKCGGGNIYTHQNLTDLLKKGDSIVLICPSCEHKINVRLAQPLKLVQSN